jgi:hypothetical protein
MTTFKIDLDCSLLTGPWLVEMGEGDDPLFTFKHDGPKGYQGLAAFEAMSPEAQAKFLASPNVFDPWLVRERFFRINNPADALAFFREYGVWRFSRSDDDVPSLRFPQSWARGREEDEPFPIRFSELIYQRNYFEDALNCKPADWLKRASISTGDLGHDAAVVWEVMYLYGPSGGYFDMSIMNFQGSIFPGPFKGSIECYEIQDALRATVLLDWMEGREWPRCKACRRVFKRTSKHPQYYCCPACASRARQASFRRNRAN